VLPRRFPPPWSVEELEARYVVRDHDGQQLAYNYYEEEPGRRSAAKLLTKNEARRIAANVAATNYTQSTFQYVQFATAKKHCSFWDNRPPVGPT
jgi:hypothetical protein